MQITIAERLCPFSHIPGTSTILPGSPYCVQIFPCLIRFTNLSSLSDSIYELKLSLQGPLEQFTIFNDLEKGRITVSGKAADGWIRYHLITTFPHFGIRLVIDKAPSKKLVIEWKQQSHLLSEKEDLYLVGDSSSQNYQAPLCDRLSFGNHKRQDWEMIRRRFDLAEMLPIIHRLGQMIPDFPCPSFEEGTLKLLDDCRKSFLQERPEKGEQTWRRFFLGCFHQMLVPQLEDHQHLGIILDSLPISQRISPLVLLSEGAYLIRKLFIQEERNQLSILPYLLPSLHCGRLLNTPLKSGGWISLEWTKKTIRRLVIYSEKDQEFHLKFRSDVRSYRLRRYHQAKGERIDCKTPLLFEKNSHYLFDNFL